MTELQQTEFELLKEFDRVCTQLGVSYFLVCGSALGAVKYQGFIPWDDDIDVAMYREDYERFLAEGPKHLAEGLFLQNYHSEPRFPQIYSKLRNSDTAYIEKAAAALPIHHGVFLDIFPLDGYPKKVRQQKWLEFWKRLYSSMLLSAFELPGGGVVYRLWRLLGIPGRTCRVAARLEKLIRRYPVGDSDLICNHGNWQGTLEYAPAEQYGSGRPAVFEGLAVRVPERYDAYLRQKYGDYTAELPPEEQTGHHYHTVCDCKRSYKNYIKNRGDF